MIKTSPEKNVQILVSLLKAHNIRIVVASPGNTNTAFVGSIQTDPFFTVYSSVDERSAAYLACGLSEESGEPVMISCTGATASRNYSPGLTEAYYRKLPVLAITSTQPVGRVGHHIAQVIDRSSIQKDVAKLSVTLPIVKDEEDYWECEVKANNAILELTRLGSGPVHIELPTTFQLPFIDGEPRKCRVIKRITTNNEFPKVNGKIGVFIGSHKTWSKEETCQLEKFCELYNGVVFCDHTSGYNGKYKLNFSLVAGQEQMNKELFKPDLTIHLGEITGDYHTFNMLGNKVWRVNEDGELRDTFKKLEYIFAMSEIDFFSKINLACNSKKNTKYFESCKSILDDTRSKIPALPFSNIWVASQLSSKLPSNSRLHLGILNTLRSWNFFEVETSIKTSSNVGGFGIDGALSTFIGNSLYSEDKLHYCILGDLAFFYDMNVLGNRHIKNNIRILIINNGKGTEFTQYNHHAIYFADEGNKYIAAAEHFGNKSPDLVKNFAENLGFDYISASNKCEYNDRYNEFISTSKRNRSMVFEVFTDSELESDALKSMLNINKDKDLVIKNNFKKLVGNKGVGLIKKVIKK